MSGATPLPSIGRPAASKVLATWIATGTATVVQVGGPGVIDPDHGALEDARDLADAEEGRLELHQGDMADLAFVRADTVDVALSVSHVTF